MYSLKLYCEAAVTGGREGNGRDGVRKTSTTKDSTTHTLANVFRIHISWPDLELCRLCCLQRRAEKKNVHQKKERDIKQTLGWGADCEGR